MHTNLSASVIKVYCAQSMKLLCLNTQLKSSTMQLEHNLLRECMVVSELYHAYTSFYVSVNFSLMVVVFNLMVN